ncbi:hypothetical protein EZH22_07990 [Xanthobacter dioxanivorans]|uniref:Uncharacterized protein n=1 Tax=Xanthobacter dioxanivorans TaxID=2528964 RepID=A0A974PRV8_9HYPH|nr:hypothetical protein [Xanthobacter dioxanivorans]QRG08239.1 hypothetical protein EZH22_07990 [Xanthobacter dioxanivorans]
MRKMIMLAATLGFVGLGTGAALAVPAPQVPADVAAVEKVAQGCGWGFHRGPWGGCRPNYYRYGGWGPRYCWWRPGPWGPIRVCR